MAAARPQFIHITWQNHAGRAEEMAAALGGQAVHIHPRALSGRRFTLLRYAVSLVLTVAALVRLLPRSVAVVNPPVFPGVVVTVWSAATRTPFLLDSHTGSFGVKGDGVARRLLPVHRWMARRAAAVMVTTQSWVEEVERWGARGIVVHEAPPVGGQLPQPPPRTRPQVLFPGVFAGDEPVAELVAAAALVPEVDFAITGDLARCPEGLREQAPDNVRFVGFLGPADYRRAVLESTALVALTTEPTSVMRCAYEAVYAGRQLVISDWPTLREVFPHGHHVPNTPDGLAAGVRAAVGGAADEQRTDALQAREAQLARWGSQLDRMREQLDLPA